MAAAKPDLFTPLTEAQVDAYLKQLSPAGLEVLVDFYRRLVRAEQAAKQQEASDGNSSD